MLPSLKGCATTVVYCDGHVPILAMLTNLQPLDHLQQKTSGALFCCLKYKLPFIQPYRAAKEAVGDVRQQVFSSVSIRRHCKSAFIYTLFQLYLNTMNPFFPSRQRSSQISAEFSEAQHSSCTRSLLSGEHTDARVSPHVSSSIWENNHFNFRLSSCCLPPSGRISNTRQSASMRGHDFCQRWISRCDVGLIAIVIPIRFSRGREVWTAATSGKAENDVTPSDFGFSLQARRL